MSAGPSLPSSQPLTSVSSLAREKPSPWRKNPERMAWVVLLVAFAIFVIMAVSIPLTVRYSIRYATVTENAVLNSTVGTVLLWTPRAGEPAAITETRKDVDVREGSRIETKGNTQGELRLTFGDGLAQSPGTVVLYPGTNLEVLNIRRPRFSSSPEPYRVQLRIHEGRVRLLTNTEEQRPVVAEVETPHGLAVLNGGSYNFKVLSNGEDGTELSVRRGRAEIFQNNTKTVTVGEGLLTWIAANQPPTAPRPAQWGLINNGDFSEGLQDWEPYSEALYLEPGKVTITTDDGRSVAHFVRQGPDGEHTEVGIRQQIDQNVDDYQSLKIQLDVKLINQTLPGAGQHSSEYPVRVEIDYTSIYGQNLRWGHGFYFRDPTQWQITDPESSKYPPLIWRPYESPNLVAYLTEQGTPPARINSIRIYASGWNYESMVSEVTLIAE